MLSFAMALLMTLFGIGIATPKPAAPPLAGKVIVIDAGHNGLNAANPSVISRPVYAGNGITKPCNTTGTATNAGYPEHAFTFDVAARVRAILVARGAKVGFTRANDRGIGPCINTRAAIGNAAYAAAVLSIHADGGPAFGRGFHVIEPATSLGGSGPLAAAHLLALRLRATFRAESGEPYANYIAGGDGLDRRGDIGGLNLSNRPAVFIECANMRNGTDAAFISSASGRGRMATAIADALTAYVRGGH